MLFRRRGLGRKVGYSLKWFSVAAEMGIPIRSAKLLLEIAVHSTDPSDIGDILGTRKKGLGMARKLLTDARETSYWI